MARRSDFQAVTNRVDTAESGKFTTRVDEVKYLDSCLPAGTG
ncbi:hypothetical protein ACWCPF_34970 [Streptomyces sp. NPDC001858]